jgi:RimJ/RimL family protein N-acetyltransferase
VPAPDSFTTARLVGRRIEPEDEPFMYAMFQDPQVTATLGGRRDEVRVRELMDRWTTDWDRRGFGVWIIRDRTTDERVGWVGLQDTDVGGSGSVELLYAVASDRWREGLATEAGRAALDIARDSLGLRELVCFTLPHNIGSHRTMKGLGFVDAGTAEHAGLPHVLTRRRLDQREDGEHG